MGKITHIIVHCSDSEFGDVPLIRSWHIARGWKDIGYHYVILNGRVSKNTWDGALDGQFQFGRLLDGDDYLFGAEVGAHTLGYNGRSIGICLIGVDQFSVAQMATLETLVRSLMHDHGIPLDNVLGHCETESGVLEGKTCPNFSVGKFRESLRASV